MTSRHASPWSAALAVLLTSVAAQSGCSSDEPKEEPAEPGGAPVLDGDGNGAIFDGEDGAGPNAGGGFDSNQACVGQEAGTELAPTIVETPQQAFACVRRWVGLPPADAS